MKLEDDLKTVPWKQTCPLRMLWTQWSTYSLTTSWTLADFEEGEDEVENEEVDEEDKL